MRIEAKLGLMMACGIVALLLLALSIFLWFEGGHGHIPSAVALGASGLFLLTSVLGQKVPTTSVDKPAKHETRE